MSLAAETNVVNNEFVIDNTPILPQANAETNNTASQNDADQKKKIAKEFFDHVWRNSTATKLFAYTHARSQDKETIRNKVISIAPGKSGLPELEEEWKKGLFNISFGLNLLNRELAPGQHAQLNDIALCNALFADYDVKDFGGDWGKVRDRLAQAPQKPTAIIKSGGGYHVYWFLSESFVVTDSNREHLKSVSLHWSLSAGADDQGSKITIDPRLPNTRNVKLAYKPDHQNVKLSDYPLVEMVEYSPENVYPFALFEESTAAARQEEEQARIAQEAEAARRAESAPEVSDERGKGLLASIKQAVANAKKSTSNDTLNREALSAFQYANAGYFTHAQVEQALTDAATARGVEGIEATLKSARRKAGTEQKFLPERPKTHSKPTRRESAETLTIDVSDEESPAEQAHTAPQFEDANSYRVYNGKICSVTTKKDEDGNETEVIHPLSNFWARIDANISRDDGEETTCKMLISGMTDEGRTLPPVEVETDEFESMKWVVSKWAGRAVITPGRSDRDKLRHAIQLLSIETGIEEERVFTHTGWREINGKRVFLHSAGAVGDPAARVELSGNLSSYEIPSDDSIDPKDAMIESLELLKVAPDNVSMPIWASMFLAPLSEIITPAFVLSVEGPSGSKKTTFTTLCLSHFGKRFSERNTPADWTGTSNSLEKMAFQTKDVPFLIDDFKPGDNHREAAKMYESLSRIVRSVGNRSGRSRLDANSELKRTYAPRGLVISTSELGASGTSVTARMMTVPVEPNCMDSQKLTERQRNRHVYGYAMRGYLEWVAENWETLKKELPTRLLSLRAEMAGDAHGRLPEAAATMMLGFDTALEFAVNLGAITADQKGELVKRFATVLSVSVEDQSEIVAQQDPALLYMQSLIAMLNSGSIRITGKGTAPHMGGNSNQTVVGWHDTFKLSLTPTAFQAVYEYCARSGGHFPVDERTLKAALQRAGYTSQSAGKNSIAQRDPESRAVIRVIQIDMVKFEKLVNDSGFTISDLHAKPAADQKGDGSIAF